MSNAIPATLAARYLCRDIYYAKYYGQLGKINKNQVLGEKMKKGKEKRRKITLKKGERPYKCIFLSYKLKKISRGGLPTPLAAENLFVGGKI